MRMRTEQKQEQGGGGVEEENNKKKKKKEKPDQNLPTELLQQPGTEKNAFKCPCLCSLLSLTVNF